jgi:hypothetical protein
MITEFNKNRFYNKSNLIVFSSADTLTNTNFYYNFISQDKYDINIHNLDLNNIYLSIYDNELYNKYDFIGIFTKEYDHHKIYEYLYDDTIYIHKSNLYIAINNKILPLIKIDIKPIIKSYNDHFNTNYSIKNLNNMPFSMSINAIYPIKIFEKLCNWLSISNINLHYQMVIFNVLEGLKLEYLDIQYNLRHYDHIPSLDYLYLSDIFDKNITTQYIENISTNALKTITYNDLIIEQQYSKDHYTIVINNKEYYNYLDPYDPIPIYYNNKLHILFNGLTNERKCHRKMYLTDLNTLIPLKSKKVIEKNWVPFIHNDHLYFIKSFKPLIYYDYNNDIEINKDISYNYYPRGNLILHNEMYIGLCYHKEYKNNIKYQGIFVYFINPETLDIIKISKQLQFNYCDNTPNPTIKCFDHNDKLITLNNIIVNVNSTFYKKKLVYSIIPLYIYEKNNEIFIIVNIQHCLSFIYKLIIKPF